MPGLDDLQQAYAKFRQTASPRDREAIDALLQNAHEQAKSVLQQRQGHVEHPGAATALTLLNPGIESLERFLPTLHIGSAYVDGQGTIWAEAKYAQLDPGWAQALEGFFASFNKRALFGRNPQIVDIPQSAKLALVGDWGTEFWQPDTPAERVRNQINAYQPDYTVHLGDVYYSGTDDEEAEFVSNWSRGSKGSFTLNSNHEMYSGGRTYFDVALAGGGPFAAQRGTSYFALRNDAWLIFGLDTAYFSRAVDLYMNGALKDDQNDDQIKFMQQTMAQNPGRRVAVVSHHEGFDLTGGLENDLFQQVAQGLGRVPDYWFWGHAHNAVVYNPRELCRCRCIGHGAVPYGVASDLEHAPNVFWYEFGPVDHDPLPRVYNGFLELNLDGPSIEEKFIGEDGSLRQTYFDAGQ